MYASIKYTKIAATLSTQNCLKETEREVDNEEAVKQRGDKRKICTGLMQLQIPIAHMCNSWSLFFSVALSRW